MELPTLATILNWVVIFFCGSGVCSLVAKFTPSVSTNTFYQWVIDGVNLWAFNTGSAKNADDTRV